MSNLFRRASDAFHHHQRKSSEDSVNQDSLVNPSQEPQEPVEPQNPAVSQPEPQESKVEDVAGENKDQAGSKPTHHHNWGWLHRTSEEEREKRRLSQQGKERADWEASKKYDHARRSSQGAGVGSEGGRQG